MQIAIINKTQKYLLLPDHRLAENLVLIFGFYERTKRITIKFVIPFRRAQLQLFSYKTFSQIVNKFWF